MIVRRPVGPPPLSLRLAAVLAVPLMLYALFATGQKALDNYRLNLEAEALRTELRALREENLYLQNEILYARTDASIEGIAREHLGLVKPGDNAVVVLSSPTREQPRPPNPPPPAHVPIWRQWFDYFFS